ncbi:MAG TPA: acetyl ornithine aminotransferase family protein [Alphaproteobacteria bacterium]|nr:acetyl ornithine aminotransferase family protein [Alphaproteobacteria bacterium]
MMIKKLNVPGPKASEILARDAATISPSYPREYPFVMDHGRGSEVWDVDGNRYIDWAAGIAVCATGHSHPEVVRAIQTQAEKFIHISSDFYHPIWVELAEKLDAIAPFTEHARCFMTNSGTEAVEAAIKLARYYTGRPHFIAFYGGFHGRTMGALAFTASKSVQRAGFFPMLSGVTHIPYPNPYRPLLHSRSAHDQGEAVLDYLERIVFAQAVPPEEVAAILVEPIQGEGGYIVPPADFFARLRQICDRYGILLIVDEVQCGMGRTGKMWAIQHWGVEPDIVCIAKGIASGMPLGAMVARQSVMTWPRGAHGNTYGGNPLSCAAALTTIRLIENGYMQNAARQGAFLMEALAAMRPRHGSIGDLRGKGLMIGIEFVNDPVSKEPAKELRDAIVHNAFKRGLLLLGCGQSVVRIMPPLNIDRALIYEGLAIFEEALTEAEQNRDTRQVQTPSPSGRGLG